MGKIMCKYVFKKSVECTEVNRFGREQDVFYDVEMIKTNEGIKTIGIKVGGKEIFIPINRITEAMRNE